MPKEIKDGDMKTFLLFLRGDDKIKPIAKSIDLYKKAKYWKDFKNIVEGNGDNDATNIAETHEKSVLIQSKGGVLYVSGIENGTSINVYSVSGTLIGTTKVSNNQASLNTNLNNGDIAIVKIGDKSVKINIQ